jgi:hypothetical protein
VLGLIGNGELTITRRRWQVVANLGTTVKDAALAIGLSLLFALSVIALAFVGVGVARTR